MTTEATGQELEDIEDFFGAFERWNQVRAGEFSACPVEHFLGDGETFVSRGSPCSFE